LAVARRVDETPSDDHFSQVTLFYRSLSPLGQDHVVAAYPFELSKLYEQTIRERQLLALANIDPDLCQRVATSLGLLAPEPTVAPVDAPTSSALTQIGETWPVAGRIVGIIVGADVEQADADTVRAAVTSAGALPLIVGPHGGMTGDLVVHRTYANAASIEFDALVVFGATPPSPDALVALDAKSGLLTTDDGPASTDPRVVKLLEETWRHAKAIGGSGAATAFTDVGIPPGAPGTVDGSAGDVAARILNLLAAHRAWDRFPTATPA
jgi:catalase